jgi:urease accessory protein
LTVQRVIEIQPAGRWRGEPVDRVVLDAGDRQRRRIVLTAEHGTTVLLDFARPVALHDGDGLVLEDGSIVEVTGLAESLVAVATETAADVVRLAWHIGNRHTEMQIAGETLRIRRDHVLEDMLRGLGARLTPVDAPFDPITAHGR